MRQKISNLICLISLIFCCYTFFQITASAEVDNNNYNPQNNSQENCEDPTGVESGNSGNSNSASNQGSFRVKSHLVFNKKIIGKARAIDGDSIKVNNSEIRLFGIDAPEYKQKCLDKNNDEYSCGMVSQDFLSKLINGKQLECFYAEKDKYDRFLSKCFVQKLSVNEEMIKSGMAVIYNFSESSKKMDELEEYAKRNKFGIWQGSFELPKNYRKNNPRI